jgi:MFS family permease
MAQQETLSASSIIIGEYNPQCSIKEVESAAAMLNLWGNLIAGIIGAIATLFWGKISDQYGRVKPLAAAATVILVSDFVMVLIAKFPDVLPLNLVYLAFVLEGIRSVSTYMYILFDAYSVPAVLSFLP